MRGLPDDSNVVTEKALYKLQDMAELAVRLGSPVSYHRYGDVIYLEDFEKGVNTFYKNLYSPDGQVIPSSTAARSGNLSMKIYTGTGATPAVKASHRLPMPELGKIGLQLAFCLSAYVQRCYFHIVYFTGSYSFSFIIRYQNTNGNLYYRDENRNDVLIEEGFSLMNYPGLFHIAKLVVDLANCEYCYLYINNRCFLLTGLKPPVASDLTLPRIDVGVEVWGDPVYAGVFYLDDVIVTQNEY